MLPYRCEIVILTASLSAEAEKDAIINGEDTAEYAKQSIPCWFLKEKAGFLMETGF